MDDRVFWQIIDMFDWDKAGDDDLVLRPASDALVALSPAEISEFHELLAATLYALDTCEHARWCYVGVADPDNGDDYISPDDFLYARCVVVANGRAFYEAVIADPRRFPAGMEFESLLYLARKAYEIRTGAPWDGVTRLSYESFSNHDGWRATPTTTSGRFTGDAVAPGNRRPS